MAVRSSLLSRLERSSGEGSALNFDEIAKSSRVKGTRISVAPKYCVLQPLSESMKRRNARSLELHSKISSVDSCEDESEVSVSRTGDASIIRWILCKKAFVGPSGIV